MVRLNYDFYPKCGTHFAYERVHVSSIHKKCPKNHSFRLFSAQDRFERDSIFDYNTSPPYRVKRHAEVSNKQMRRSNEVD